MKYASVVVTYNRKTLLLEAIKSLLTQSVPPEKVIILDNHSTDDSKEAIMQQFSDQSDLIDYQYLDENLGGSAGFYFGLQRALEYNVEWISLSDDDAIYHNDYFAKLGQAMQNNPDTLAFSGTVKLPDGTIQLSHRKNFTSRSTLATKKVALTSYDADFYYDSYTFVGITINKALIEKIGLPEKDFFIWYDDAEYSMRTIQYSRVLNVSSAEITHKTSLTTSFAPTWKMYYGIRNRMIAEQIHTNNILVFYGYNFYLQFRKYVSLVTNPAKKAYRGYLFKQYSQGFWDGLIKKTGKNKKYLPK